MIPDGVEPELGENSFEKIFDREVLFRSPGIHTSKLDKARKRKALKEVTKVEVALPAVRGHILLDSGE